MLMLSISAVVLVLSMKTTQGYYMPYGEGLSRMPMCATPNKPCRLRVKVDLNNGSEMESNSAEMCTCNPPYECSSDWSKPGHVVSRKVVSTSSNITLQMMFCRGVEPKNLCRRRNISLVVKGSLAMPLDIASYNCRCRRRQPLVLHQRTIGDDHMVYHSYVCANHKDRCSTDEACMTIRQSRTDYNCKCGRDAPHCNPPNQWVGEVAHGFCAPHSS